MKLLLDSHALVWSVDAPKKLSPAAATALQDPANDLLVSAATVWEIAIKLSLGKLKLTLPYRQWMNQAIADLDLTLIPITVENADVQVTLPYHHRDPFDRLLVAQALSDGCPIVSVDNLLDPYGITRLW